MRKLAWKIVFIIGLLALCVWSFYPPSEKVRLGRDLQGGVSLIYRVNIDARDPNPQGTISQVITVLKERVNPTGGLDISLQSLGRDRIEIVMPLPNEEVQARRKQYAKALIDLLRLAYIAPNELQTALETDRADWRYHQN